MLRKRKKPTPYVRKTDRVYPPSHAAAHKANWSDPDYYAKMCAARRRSAEARRADPHRYSRLGIPTGWRKEEAYAALAEANKLADTFMREFEENGMIPAVVVPDSEEAMAKAVLREAFVIALAPGDKRIRLQAIGIVLRFTKALPAQRIEAGITTAEQWLVTKMKELKNDQR
jgi:hypothetical protein